MATAVSHLRQWLVPRRWWSALARLLHRPKKHPFDRAHGVDTDGLLYADALATGHAHDDHNAGYYATAPSLFRGGLELWRGTLAGTGYGAADYTLVDIGCGKGRVLMLAADYSFRAIVGIELNPRLTRVARKNLHKWLRRPRACPGVRIIEGDALSFPLPEGPLALFYFNSFERELTEQWLSRLAETARARTQPLDLIYIHPEFDALVRQLPGVQVLAETNIPLSTEDAEADAFGVASDMCAVYRLRG